MLRIVILFVLSAMAAASQQVTSRDIANAGDNPANWLTYNGSYDSRHYRKLDQIKTSNVSNLELKWVWQAHSLEKFESCPLVVDGVMYVVQMPNDVVALDARTGREFWRYEHAMQGKQNVCCGRVNRGLAVLGERLFMGTIDGKLLALDAKTGALEWEKQLVDPEGGYSLTTAPLVVKDKLVLGTAGGEYGIRGWLGAFSPEDGKELWRFWIIPGPGEPGHESWGGDSWQRGGGSIWLTGSYDPELDLMYWGTGNPAPDWNGDVRPGDNLYTDSVIAIDPDDGKLKWHFQFTPHDVWDYDSVQIPVLADREWGGRQRKLILWGNRNGFFYVLDRTNGEFLLGKPFATVTWASGLDKNGRPIRMEGAEPSRGGVRTWPSVQGATNWYAPTYNPETGLFAMSTWEYASVYHKGDPTYTRGNRYIGSLPRGVWPDVRKDENPGYGEIQAIDPEKGEAKWRHRMTGISESGLLSTSGGLIFSGSLEGYFFALDATNGELLWRTNVGGRMANTPITYTAEGEQLVTVAAGNALFTFGLRE